MRRCAWSAPSCRGRSPPPPGCRPRQALALRERLRALFPRFGYASCVPFGREPDARLGLRFRAALAAPADDALLRRGRGRAGPGRRARCCAMPTPAAASAARWRCTSDGALRAFMLAGDIAADDWVLALLQQRQPAAAFGRALLAASRQPPQAVAAAQPAGLRLPRCQRGPHRRRAGRVERQRRANGCRRCSAVALRHRLRLLPAGGARRWCSATRRWRRSHDARRAARR